MLVDGDEAAVHGDAGLGVPDVVGHRTATDGDQQQLAVEGLAVLQRDGDAGVGDLGLGEPHAEGEVDAAPAERALEELRARLLLAGQQVGSASTIVTSAPKDFQTLANSTPMTPPPRTTTDDGAFSRRNAWSLLMMRSPSISRPGQRAGVGAGREDQRLRGGVRRAVDLDGVRRRHPAGALDDRDVATLHQAGEALVEPIDDAVLVLVDPRHVDALEGRLDADLLALASGVGDLGGVEQGLGRDAAAVQAGAADLAAFDHDHREVELGGAQRAGITAAAAAKDDEVGSLRVSHGHVSLNRGGAPIVPPRRRRDPPATRPGSGSAPRCRPSACSRGPRPG